MGKRCPYCRQIISDDSLFCPECGREYPTGKTCSSCGAAICDEDVYCPNCGVVVVKGKACYHCGGAISDEDVYCPNCGVVVAEGKYCSHCHAAINEDDLFCQNCGAKLNKGEGPYQSDDKDTTTRVKHDSPKVVEVQPVKTIVPPPHPTESDNKDNASDDLEELEETTPKKYGKWIVISLIAIVLIGGGAYFLLNRSEGNWESQGEIVTNGSRMLYGTIGELPITMELHLEASKVDGSMYYNKYGPNNKLFLSGSLHNNEIELIEHNKDGMETGRYKGKYSNRVFQGEYINYKGDVYSIYLSEAGAENNEKEDITKSHEEMFDDVVKGNLLHHKITESDIRDLSKDELSLLRNSIYAHHGYRFTRDDLFNYFSQFSWYNPTTSDMNAAYNSMSDIEKYNIDFIKSHE